MVISKRRPQDINIKDIIKRILNGKYKRPSFNIGKNLITGKISENPKVLIKSLMNSNDTNTANLGYLLNDLEYKYGIKLNKQLTNYILENLELDIFANPLYRRKKIDYYQIISYGCILNYVNKMGMYGYFLDTFYELLGVVQNPDKEFDTLVDFLFNYVNNDSNNVLNLVLEDYQKVFKKGNKEEVLTNLRKMVILIDLHHVRFINTNTTSYCDKYNKIIALNNDMGDELVTIHEVGHMINDYYRFEEENYDLMRKKACLYAFNNPNFENRLKSLCITVNLVGGRASVDYDNVIKLRYGNINNYVGVYQNYIIAMINSGRLFEIFSIYNLSQEQINKIILDYNTSYINVYEFAKMLYSIDYSNYRIKCMENVEESFVLDIISAIFKSNKFRFFDQDICLPISHDAAYYQKYANNSISEILADFNVLKVTGRDDLIEILREMFGNEFLVFIEKIYEKDSFKNDNRGRKR